MIKTINECYGCPRPCCSHCSQSSVEVRICDDCCDEEADYRVDGEDLCEGCLRERLREELQEMLDDVNNGSCLNVQGTAEQLGYNVEVL